MKKKSGNAKKLEVRRASVKKLSDHDLEKAGGGLNYNTAVCTATSTCTAKTDACYLPQ